MSTNAHGHAWTGRAFAALAGLVAFTAIVFLTIGVARELRLMDSVRYDNVQWSLSQVEVEFLVFSAEVTEAHFDPLSDLDELRLRFDVFFSRITTMSNAAVYASLFAVPGFPDTIRPLQAFLDRTVPLIDSPDPVLRAGLPDLRAELPEIRRTVRRMSTAGLEQFAMNGDNQRRTIGITLTWLAVVVAGLITALAVAVVYLNWLNLQIGRRQRQISQTAARMNTIIATSLDAVIVSDAAGRIMQFNPAAEVIFGHRAEAVLGRDLGALILSDGDTGDTAPGERPNGMVGMGLVRLNAQRADGQVFPVELSVQSAQTDDGEIFIAFLRDISIRVGAEQQLVTARDRALANERMKTDFLATMSHEIRTPLNGLLGTLALFNDTGLTQRQSRHVRNMEISGRLLLSHVTDVLDITRYDAGKLVIRRVAVNVGTVLQDIFDSQSGVASAQGTTLDWGWQGPAENWIEADPDRLSHILLNLIANAVKFTPKGKVNVRVQITARAGTNAEIEFQVEDTGKGIAPDLRDQVFDDFVTGNTAYDREVGGTGLGLSIARRFANAMGGDIGLGHSSAKGTMFWLRLPVVIAAAGPDADDPALKTIPPGRSLNVLIVEDNEINRIVARDMLRAAGHRTTEAHDGAIGVQLAARTRFDLILMDISMPVLDGRAATRMIRAGHGASARTPIVALTANALASEQAAFQQDGMTDILTKPLSRAALHCLTSQIAGAGPATAPVIHRSHTDEMRQSLGEEGYATLLARFVDETDTLIAALASQTNDPADLEARCHRTAGSAAVFGATALRANLMAIGAAAKSGDVAGVRAHAAHSGAIWAATLSVLDNAPQRQSAV